MEKTLAFGADDFMGSNEDGTGLSGEDGPRVHLDSPAQRRSSRRCRAGWAAPVVEKGGCAPPIAQAGCVGPYSRNCVRRLHLLAGHHVKVPNRCLPGDQADMSFSMLERAEMLCFRCGQYPATLRRLHSFGSPNMTSADCVERNSNRDIT